MRVLGVGGRSTRIDTATACSGRRPAELWRSGRSSPTERSFGTVVVTGDDRSERFVEPLDLDEVAIGIVNEAVIERELSAGVRPLDCVPGSV